jgi:hypothetical protein
MGMQQTTTDRQRLFGIYLDDHRAGAAGGLALAQRMLEENPDNYLTATMRELTGEIDQDRSCSTTSSCGSATHRIGSRTRWGR